MTRVSSLLLFITGLSLGLGGCTPVHTSRSNVTSVKADTTASLHVSLKRATLTVTLLNVGEREICVDRELVFLLAIVPVSTEGDAVGLQEVSVAQAAPSSLISSRFILLQPGESVQRCVTLNEPFKQFTSGIAAPSMTVTAYEGLYIVPQDKRISEFRITYGYQYGTREGLELYLSNERLPEGIYEGPLMVNLSVVK
jgi:hypothetical protein